MTGIIITIFVFLFVFFLSLAVAAHREIPPRGDESQGHELKDSLIFSNLPIPPRGDE